MKWLKCLAAGTLMAGLVVIPVAVTIYRAHAAGEGETVVSPLLWVFILLAFIAGFVFEYRRVRI